MLNYKRIVPKLRNKFSSFTRSINALVIQTYLDQEGRLTFGYFFTILRPLLITLLVSLVLRAFSNELSLEDAIKIFLFPAAVFFLIRELIGTSTYLDNRRVILYLPNVNYYSLVLANCISIFLIYSPIFFLCFGISSYQEYTFDFIKYLELILVGALLGFAYQFLVSIIIFENKFLITIHSYVPISLLFLSCVFFPLDSLPKEVQYYFLFNPMVHILEEVRTLFTYSSVEGVDLNYTYKFIGGLIIFILPTYYVKTQFILRRFI